MDMNMETYQDRDVSALMSIIRIAEQDIKNGRVKKAVNVFRDLRMRIEKRGKDDV